MTETVRADQKSLASQLARYGWAVGTGTLLSQQALADGIDFDPLGSLPIVVDSNVLETNPVEIDLDGDTVNDFQFFHREVYGGGFVIRTIGRVDGVDSPRVQQVNGPCCEDYNRASRHDRTEFVSPDNSSGTGFYYSDYKTANGSPDTFIDAAGALPTFTAYTPFRDNPGFLGLSLGRTAMTSGYAGTLKIEVNAAGTQLSILGGSYRQDGLDIYLDDGILFEDGFESPGQSDYFPPAGLKDLALGSKD